jgi:DNA end-binding protein Ku
MAASLWKGSLSFGLVNILVRLQPAVRTRGGEIHFRQLHRTDLAPIKYERVCSADGKPVAWGDIVKGYEYRKGKFVALSDADLKAARLESSPSIEILQFVKEQEIDPRFFETPYYLVPEKGAEKAYALLRQAMHATGMTGIAKFTLRQKLHLVSVKSLGNALTLELMRFADELVESSELKFPAAEGVRPQELAMAEQLIGNLAEPFDASKFVDDYHENVMRIINAKLEGEEIVADEQESPAGTKVTDLLARLQESLAQAKAAPPRQHRAPRTHRAARSPARTHTRKTA